MKHILFIGGTGMLNNAVNHIINKNYKISITGRNKSRLNSFANNNPQQTQNINLIQSDYSNTENFLSSIKNAEEKFGIIDTAILWIHSDGKDSMLKLIEHLKSKNQNVIIYHIKGSAAYKPNEIKTSELEILKDNINYREIFLGFKIENGNSRWLTDEEISDGVIYAFENNLIKYTIGVTEPWELRP